MAAAEVRRRRRVAGRPASGSAPPPQTERATCGSRWRRRLPTSTTVRETSAARSSSAVRGSLPRPRSPSRARAGSSSRRAVTPSDVNRRPALRPTGERPHGSGEHVVLATIGLEHLAVGVDQDSPVELHRRRGRPKVADARIVDVITIGHSAQERDEFQRAHRVDQAEVEQPVVDDRVAARSAGRRQSCASCRRRRRGRQRRSAPLRARRRESSGPARSPAASARHQPDTPAGRRSSSAAA